MTPSQRIRLGGIAAVVLAAACSSGPEGSAPISGGSAQAGASTTAGAGAGAGTSTGAGTTSTGPTAVAVSAGGGGESTFVCDPPAAPGSFYERTADAFGSAEPASMCAYRGDALLIVNVAAI